ncbi:MAG: hypothetical protein VW397_01835 [Candidatus Margulisiibacteriota bacterium]
MSKKFSDRILLRRIKRVFNRKPFQSQNILLSKISRVSPEWFHQSRVNYHYIYSNLKTYWPDWVIKQHNPFQSTCQPPTNEFTCLNQSFQTTFEYSPNNPDHLFTLNTNGFIAFPNYLWGILFKVQINDQIISPFEDNIQFNDASHNLTGKVTINDFNISMAIGFDGDLKINLKIKNQGDKSQQIKLFMSTLPYTNEGVGFISNIQYTSQRQFVINDRSIISASEQPHNILCSTYEDGSIFNLIPKWEMVLNANCDEKLSSGIMAYHYDIPANETASVLFKVNHLKRFITPLIPKLLSKKPTRLKSYSIAPNSFLEPSFSLPESDTIFDSLPPKLSKIKVLTQTFLINSFVTQGAMSIESVFYSIQALLTLGCESKVLDLFKNFPKEVEPVVNFMPDHFLSLSQQRILIYLLQYELASDAKLNVADLFTKRFILKLQKQILKDRFIFFVKQLNLNQFNTVLHGPKFFSFFLKLILFSGIIDRMISLKIDTPALNSVQMICQGYFKIIFNHEEKLMAFINEFHATPRLETSLKLFIIDQFLIDIPDPFPKTKLVSLFENNWHKDHFYDHQRNNGFSEKNELIYSKLTNPKNKLSILENYLNQLNALGNYDNKQCFYHTFSVFPKRIKSYHAIFLTSFFQMIFSSIGDELIISSLLWFKNIKVRQIRTKFGKINIESQSNKLDYQLKIQLTHKFHRSPTHIRIMCPNNCTHYSFSKIMKQNTTIQNNIIDVPLNKSIIYLY